MALFDAKTLSRIQNLETQRNLYFTQLGEAFYHQNKESQDIGDLQMRSLVQNIAALEEEINAYQKSEQPNQDTTLCQVCGTPVRKDCPFCSSCGAKVNHETVTNQKVCKSCGSILREGNDFCTICGSHI